MKLIVKSKDSEIEAEAMINGEVKKFGSSAHVIVPKKWVGHNVVVLVKRIVGGWNEGYLRGLNKNYSRKGINKIQDRKLKDVVD